MQCSGYTPAPYQYNVYVHVRICGILTSGRAHSLGIIQLHALHCIMNSVFEVSLMLLLGVMLYAFLQPRLY